MSATSAAPTAGIQAPPTESSPTAEPAVLTTSTARIEANRRNAQHSTGPRTPDGKAKVASNALKHGLRSERNPLDLAKDATLPFEQTEFLATLATFMEQFAPQNPFETLLVERLAQIDLRLNRAIRMETAHMEHHATAVWKNIGAMLPEDPRTRDGQLLMFAFDSASAALKLIHQYESRLARDFARTLAQLRQSQKLRNQTQPVAYNPLDTHQSPVGNNRVATAASANHTDQNPAKQTQANTTPATADSNSTPQPMCIPAIQASDQSDKENPRIQTQPAAINPHDTHQSQASNDRIAKVASINAADAKTANQTQPTPQSQPTHAPEQTANSTGF